MNRLILLAIGLAALADVSGGAAAPGLKEGKKEESDVQKLEGDWTIESWVQFGQPINAKWTWSFKGEKYTLDQGTNLEEGTIKLDPKKKPATIDLAITGGKCAGNDQPGIYKVDGDTLTMCLAWPGTTDRPTAFESPADKQWILITFKRAKK